MIVQNPTIKGKRHQIVVTIDPDQNVVVTALARQRRTSKAAIIREAVDTYVAVNRREVAALGLADIAPEAA